MTDEQQAPPTEAPKTESAGTTVADLSRSAALEIKGQQSWWTAPQRAALASIGLADTPDGDLIAFLHLCQATGLDPFRREIYLIGRKQGSGQRAEIRWTAQTGIDGFRFIAERTGEYLGRTDPEWCGPDGQWRDVWLAEEPPAAARVQVKRRNPDGGDPIVTTGTVMYREFCPMKDEWVDNKRTGNKVPQGQWGTMPAHMLAKCAEAFAIRSAFPRQVSGVYLHEEMQKADEAAKEAAAAEQAEARRKAREDAREQGVRRPWAAREGVVLTPPSEEAPEAVVEPQEAAAEPPVDDDGIEDAVLVEDGVPTIDRDALFAELDEQAKTLNVTRAALTRRWAAQHRKNVEDATDEELLAVVIGYREMVASKHGGQPE